MVLVGFGVGLGLGLGAFGVGLIADFVGAAVGRSPADVDGLGGFLALALGLGFGLFVGLGAAVGLVDGGTRVDAEGAGVPAAGLPELVTPPELDSSLVAARAAVPQAVATRAPAAATTVPPLTIRQPRARRSAGGVAGWLRACRGADGLTGWLSTGRTSNSRAEAWRAGRSTCR